MGINNAIQATVDDSKVVDYLLSPVHPVGRFKCVFFERLGFSRERPMDLVAALMSHAARAKAVTTTASQHGEKQIATDTLTGPNGKSAEVVAVWLTPPGGSAPRLVTAYPARRAP